MGRAFSPGDRTDAVRTLEDTMSRTALTALFALALIACDTNTESEQATREVSPPADRTVSSWTGPPAVSGVTVAPAPMIGPSAPPEVAETVPEVADAGASSDTPGSVEDLVDGEGDSLLEIEVRPGESLVLLARWSGLSVEAIADANGIRTGATLYPGQLLEVEVDSKAFSDMQDARDIFEDVRLDRYLERRGTLVGVTTHTVGTGETAWQIGRDHGALPLWVVASFNRDLNLDRLRIGQEVNLPMLGDTVAMEEGDVEDSDSVSQVDSAPSAGEVKAPEDENSTNP